MAGRAFRTNIGTETATEKRDRDRMQTQKGGIHADRHRDKQTDTTAEKQRQIDEPKTKKKRNKLTEKNPTKKPELRGTEGGATGT